MSIALIFQAIIAVLKFPDAMSAFIKLVSKSDDQKRQEITAGVQKQLQDFEDTGRPS